MSKILYSMKTTGWCAPPRCKLSRTLTLYSIRSNYLSGNELSIIFTPWASSIDNTISNFTSIIKLKMASAVSKEYTVFNAELIDQTRGVLDYPNINSLLVNEGINVDTSYSNCEDFSLTLESKEDFSTIELEFKVTSISEFKESCRKAIKTLKKVPDPDNWVLVDFNVFTFNVKNSSKKVKFEFSCHIDNPSKEEEIFQDTSLQTFLDFLRFFIIGDFESVKIESIPEEEISGSYDPFMEMFWI